MKRISLFLFALFPAVAHAADLNWQSAEASAFSDWTPSSFVDFDIDGTTDQVEFVFQCKESCAVSALGYRSGTAAGTPVAHEYRLQGVNASGRADGTTKASGNAKGSFTPTASDDGKWKWVTLTSTYTCSRGEFLAGVIVPTGTPSGVNKNSFSYKNNNWPGVNFPHAWTVDAGSGTSQGGLAPFAYKCSSTAYGVPVEDYSTHDFGSDSTPDERGNQFALPSGACSTFTVGGARLRGYLDLAASTATVTLYSGTTALQTVDLDGDLYHNPGGVNGYEVYFDETSLSTLNCGTDYILAVKPNATGGTKLGTSYFTINAAGDMSAYPLGTAMFAVNRTDAGAWSNETTKRLIIEPLIKDMTGTGGSGGLINHNQVSGGSQ